MAEYRTAPDHNETGWPKGVPYIIGNEGCERFSFYGMKAILFVYLTFLLNQSGVTGQLAEKQATDVFHTWVAGVYALPMIGAMIADRWWGKYNTIIWLSLVYCAGHACMAIFDGHFTGTIVGLVLIAVGSGGIKPCVSAHVGDQFGRGNWDKVERIYQAFYFIINFGSMFSTILIPRIKEHWGDHLVLGRPQGVRARAAQPWRQARLHRRGVGRALVHDHRRAHVRAGARACVCGARHARARLGLARVLRGGHARVCAAPAHSAR
jgi:POT family proton-dependent oligopeptide transporter